MSCKEEVPNSNNGNNNNDNADPPVDYSTCPVTGTWWYRLDYDITFTFESDGKLLVKDGDAIVSTRSWKPMTGSNISILGNDGNWIPLSFNSDCGGPDSSHSYKYTNYSIPLKLWKSSDYTRPFVLEGIHDDHFFWPERKTNYSLFDNKLYWIGFDSDRKTISGYSYIGKNYIEYPELGLGNPSENKSIDVSFGTHYSYYNLEKNPSFVAFPLDRYMPVRKSDYVYLWTCVSNGTIYYCLSKTFSDAQKIKYTTPIPIQSNTCETISSKVLYPDGITWSDTATIYLNGQPELIMSEDLVQDRTYLNSFLINYSKTDSLSVELFSCSGNDIYYTTDGSDPKTSNTAVKFSGAFCPFQGNNNLSKRIRAVEVKDNSAISTSFFCLSKSGPAGYPIIYDKGTYSDGWRYIEMSEDCISLNNNDELAKDFVFGVSKNPETGITTNFNKTSSDIGGAQTNQNYLLTTLGDEAYTSTAVYDNSKTKYYAAKVCDEYESDGFSDWLLPTLDEMVLYQERNYDLYDSITTMGASWSSTINNQKIGHPDGFWHSGSTYDYDPSSKHPIYPERYF